MSDSTIINILYVLKSAATDMRYARCKFSSSLVHKKNFRFIWKVVFKLGDVKRGRILLLSLNELWEKSQATATLGKFVKSHNQTLIGL